MDNAQLTFEKISPVALPSFQSRVHCVHTTLKTPRKRMANAIRLLLTTPAQKNAEGLAQRSNTQFLPRSKPHVQKLLTQFLKHLPTHHPEIESISAFIMKLKTEILKIPFDKKRNREWHGTATNERFGAMAGVSRWIALQNNMLTGSWQVCVARHCAKPPPR